MFDTPSFELPRFIAHRGAPWLAPENSLASLCAASECGAQWIECDVQLSLDMEVMVFHDSCLKRMTTVSGKLQHKSCAELQGLYLKSELVSGNEVEKIPPFSQWLSCAVKHRLGVNGEIKGRYKNQLLVDRVLSQIKHVWPSNSMPPLLSSFTISTFNYLASFETGYPFAVNLHRWPYWLPNVIHHKDCFSVHLNERIATKKRVEYLLSLGKRVCCYTVNSHDRANQLFEMGVTSVFTDNHHLMGLTTFDDSFV